MVVDNIFEEVSTVNITIINKTTIVFKVRLCLEYMYRT